MFGGKSGSRAAVPVRRAGRARVLRIIGEHGAAESCASRHPPPSDRPRPRARDALQLAGRAHARSACLDLFAGSGALGLEALSRGASHVTFVEHDEAAVRELRAAAHRMQAGDARVERADALRYLAGEARPFDLVFLDPPFASELLSEAARMLEERHWLDSGALIYVECAARAGLPTAAGVVAAAQGEAGGEVGYHLFARTAP